MHLYRMGPAAGPHRVGVNRDAAALFERQKPHLPEASTFSMVELGTGEAMMALAQLRTRKAMKGDWLFASEQAAGKLLHEAADQVNGLLRLADQVLETDSSLMGGVMRYIRMEVFGTTQEVIGKLVQRSESLISRWEKGEVSPGLDELWRLRTAAVELGLRWDDRLLLDPASFLQSRADQEN